MMYYKKIHKLREDFSFSQEDLAKKIGVSPQAISKWELGTVMPDINNLLKLSSIFNVSVDFLLKDDNKESDFSYYPINKQKEKNIEKYQIISLVIMVLSVMTFITFVLISIVEPIIYYDLDVGIQYEGLRAYWFIYPEVKYGVLISLISFLISMILLFFPKKYLKRIIKG